MPSERNLENSRHMILESKEERKARIKKETQFLDKLHSGLAQKEQKEIEESANKTYEDKKSEYNKEGKKTKYTLDEVRNKHANLNKKVERLMKMEIPPLPDPGNEVGGNDTAQRKVDKEKDQLREWRSEIINMRKDLEKEIKSIIATKGYIGGKISGFRHVLSSEVFMLDDNGLMDNGVIRKEGKETRRTLKNLLEYIPIQKRRIERAINEREKFLGKDPTDFSGKRVITSDQIKKYIEKLEGEEDGSLSEIQKWLDGKEEEVGSPPELSKIPQGDMKNLMKDLQAGIPNLEFYLKDRTQYIGTEDLGAKRKSVEKDIEQKETEKKGIEQKIKPIRVLENEYMELSAQFDSNKESITRASNERKDATAVVKELEKNQEKIVEGMKLLVEKIKKELEEKFEGKEDKFAKSGKRLSKINKEIEDLRNQKNDIDKELIRRKSSNDLEEEEYKFYQSIINKTEESKKIKREMEGKEIEIKNDKWKLSGINKEIDKLKIKEKEKEKKGEIEENLLKQSIEAKKTKKKEIIDKINKEESDNKKYKDEKREKITELEKEIAGLNRKLALVVEELKIKECVDGKEEAWQDLLKREGDRFIAKKQLKQLEVRQAQAKRYVSVLTGGQKFIEKVEKAHENNNMGIAGDTIIKGSLKSEYWEKLRPVKLHATRASFKRRAFERQHQTGSGCHA